MSSENAMRLALVLACALPAVAAGQGLQYAPGPRPYTPGPVMAGAGGKVVVDLPFTTSGCFASPAPVGNGLVTMSRTSSQTISSGAQSCGTSELAVETTGLAVYKTAVQLYPTPSAPATGTVTFTATGAHTFSVIGSGSQTISLGTATGTGFPCAASAASPCALSVTATGTATLGAVTGSLSFGQVETGTYRTPQITSFPSTRASATPSVPVPPLGNRWCIATTITPGQNWNVAPTAGYLWSTYAGAVTNAIQVYRTGTNWNATMWDSAGAVKSTSFAHGLGANRTPHRVTLCNASGFLNFYVDGLFKSSLTGAGTGLQTATLTPIRIGTQFPGGTELDGELSRFRICAGAVKPSECR